MEKITERQAQVLAACAVAGVLLVLLVVLFDLADQAEQVQVPVIRIDLAAYEFAAVLDEAKRITFEAAGEL